MTMNHTNFTNDKVPIALRTRAIANVFVKPDEQSEFTHSVVARKHGRSHME